MVWKAASILRDYKEGDKSLKIKLDDEEELIEIEDSVSGATCFLQYQAFCIIIQRMIDSQMCCLLGNWYTIYGLFVMNAYVEMTSIHLMHYLYDSSADNFLRSFVHIAVEFDAAVLEVY